MKQPIGVFRICHRDGRYFSVSATRLSINRSWWKVRHNLGDGKFKDDNYNGGRLPGFGLRPHMHETVRDAWLEMVHILAIERRIAKTMPEMKRYQQRFAQCLSDMWREGVEFGELHGHILGSLGKPLPEREDKP